MNLFMEFTREALAELECVTGDYEAKVSGLGVNGREVGGGSTCQASPITSPTSSSTS
jgi:hypothetical protein